MNYTLALAEEAAQLVLNALAELPFKLVHELVQDILQQVHSQKSAQQAPAAQVAQPAEPDQITQ